MFALFLLCTVSLRIFFSALWIGNLGYLGCFDPWICESFRMRYEFRKLTMDKESWEGVWKLFYQHYYDFLKWKTVKVDLEKIIITSYYQITEVFESVLSIQQHYWKKIKNITVQPEVNMACRLKSEAVSEKLLIYENLRRRTNF